MRNERVHGLAEGNPAFGKSHLRALRVAGRGGGWWNRGPVGWNTDCGIVRVLARAVFALVVLIAFEFEVAFGATPSVWHLVATNAGWLVRDSLAATVFDGRIWMLGGSGPTDSGYAAHNDVWWSRDGAQWVRTTAEAGWAGRSFPGLVSHNNRLWVMGGYIGYGRNDVWSSGDGVNWQMEVARAGWSGRFGMGCQVFLGRIWVFGGESVVAGVYTGKQDIWSSVDGRNWTLEAAVAPWGPRGFFGATVFDDRLWVFGGEAFDSGNPTVSLGYRNDVWSTVDGVNWARESDSPSWRPRAFASASATTDRMWLLGGYDSANPYGLSEAWWSANGRDWFQEEGGVPWSRYAGASVAFKNRAWLLGGQGQLNHNDVWFARGNRSPVVIAGAGSTNLALTPGSLNVRYGTVLSVDALGIDGNLPGNFALTPSAGSLLPLGVSDVAVRFTPVESGYPSVTGVVAVTVTASARPPDVKWSKVQAGASFPPMDGAGALVFKGEMWLLGGWAPGTVPFPYTTNGVWKSPDGANWAYVTSGPWSPRHFSGYAVHDGKMWVVGGDPNSGRYLNDVWNSPDGTNWVQVASDVPWRNRSLHCVVAFDGKLFVMGGQKLPQFITDGSINQSAEEFYNDVWSTADGITWVQVTEHAPWAPRGGIAGSVVLDGRMWILGGGTYPTPGRDGQIFNDVWSSTNGRDWTLELASAPWNPRYYHSVGVFKNQMWLVGGVSGQDLGDVWASYDGREWRQPSGVPWPPRHAQSMFVHSNALWIAAGTIRDGEMANDVWKLTISSNVLAAATGTPDLTVSNGRSVWTYGAALDGALLGLTSPVPGSFRLTPAVGQVLGAGQTNVDVIFTPNDSNYMAVTGSVVVAVEKAPLVVRAVDRARTYGLSRFPLDYSIQGFTNGDTLESSGIAGFPALGTSAVADSPVGAYPITIDVRGMSAANYSFSGQTGVLSVARWFSATNSAPWNSRVTPGLVSAKGQMWLLGGLTTSQSGIVSRQNDVWNSIDGTNWNRATAGAAWTGRNGHGTAFFNDRLWVAGGYDGVARNDVWSSPDGVAWTREVASAPWSGRFSFGFLTFQGHLWVIGGLDYAAGGRADVWKSADGRSWSKVLELAPWGPRGEFACVEFAGRIWMYAGKIFNASNPATSIGLARDVWSSADGVSWTREVSSVPWAGRTLAGAAATQGRLWLLGGYSNNLSGLREAWWSETGRDWYQDADAIPWSSRYGAAAVAFQDRIWLMGGAGPARTNDVWFASGSRLPPVLSGAGSTNLEVNPGVIVANYGYRVSITNLGARATVPGMFGLAPPDGSRLPVGTNQVQVIFTPEDRNFGVLTGLVSVLVRRANLMVEAENQARPVGGANPPLTFRITGFVDGESPAALTSLPVTTTSADMISAAGAYPIAVSGGSAANYEFSYTSGLLTVFEAVAVQQTPASTNFWCDAVILQATASAYPPPRLQWLKDGLPLADGIRISGANASRLVIGSLRNGDGGEYSLQVSNEFISVTSAPSRLTVLVPSPVPATSVTLSLPSTTNARNTEISMPVAVAGISRVSTLQFSVRWDPSVVQYLGWTAGSLSVSNLISVNEEQAGSGTIGVTVEQGDGSPMSVPDGSSILLLRLRAIGLPRGRSSVTIEGTPVVVEARNCLQLPAAIAVNPGLVEVASVEIAGTVGYGPTGLPIAGLAVTVTSAETQTTTTDSQGRYRIGVDPGQSYRILPERPSERRANGGVTSSDIILIRRRILGIQPFGLGYQAAVADVDGNGGVSTADITLLRRFVLGLTNAFPTGLWRVLPASAISGSLSNWPTQSVAVTLTNLMTNATGVDFALYKLGDVDGSWIADSDGPVPAMRRVPAMTGIGITLAADRVAASLGEVVSYRVRVGGCTNLTSLQFSLVWDVNQLEFIDVGDFGLPGLSMGNFGPLSPASAGRLAISWDDPSGEGGALLEDGGVAFRVQFRVVGEQANAPIVFSNDSVPTEAIGNGVPISVLEYAGAVFARSSVGLNIGAAMRKIPLGSTLAIDGSVSNGIATGFQWLRNGVPLADVNGLQLRLPVASRSSGGVYSLTGVDVDGVPVLSGESAVSVVSPVRLQPVPSASEGLIKLIFSDADGAAISVDRASSFFIEASESLRGDDWIPVPTSQLLMNGKISVTVTNEFGGRTRFFRVIER